MTEIGWWLPDPPVERAALPAYLGAVRAGVGVAGARGVGSVWLSGTASSDALDIWAIVAHLAGLQPQLLWGTIGESLRPSGVLALARAASTVQVLTAGRVVVGVGPAGTARRRREAAKSAESDRLAEEVDALRRLWREPRVTMRGRYVRLTDASVLPVPEPPPQIMVTIDSDLRLLPVAARWADCCCVRALTPAGFDSRRFALEQALREVGRDAADLALSLAVPFLAIARTREEALRLTLDPPSLAPAELVVGTPADVVAQLLPWVERGVGLLQLRFADFPSTAGLELFMREVLPALQLRVGVPVEISMPASAMAQIGSAVPSAQGAAESQSLPAPAQAAPASLEEAGIPELAVEEGLPMAVVGRSRTRRVRRRGCRAAAAALLALLVVASLVLARGRAGRSSPLPAQGDVVWSADMESGSLSQWTADQGGEAVFNTGSGSVEVTQEQAHGGTHALKLSISGASGQVQAARIFRWHENQSEAYYSAWLYVPRTYRPKEWWDIFQFKGKTTDDDPESTPLWVVDVNSRPDGSMYLYLWDARNRRSFKPNAAVNVPIGTWFEITAYYRRAEDHSGRIALWQDGTLLYDIDHVQTAIGPDVQWSLANYTDDIDPPNPTIYADDAKIRVARRP